MKLISCLAAMALVLLSGCPDAKADGGTAVADAGAEVADAGGQVADAS